jgi:XTP/dITP diphosphohydrolase
MQKIYFASGNANKIKEIGVKLGSVAEIAGLSDLGFSDDIPETGSTLHENAAIKARFIYEKFAVPCFADDTGLMIEALNGAPGVYSARYAGDQRSASDNMEKVLLSMAGELNRNALFRTVICLILEGHEHFFVGDAPGTIQRERRGTEGFGYDPIFIPLGSSRTFAEMNLQEKNALSHRAKAIAHLKNFLEKRR